VAGDYDVCLAAAEQAGAMVTDTFKEFEQLLELSVALHGKTVRGVRLGALSNAGFETVGMADAIQGQRYRVEIATLAEATRRRLGAVLGEHGLGGLVNARNPLDLTPMAKEDVYEGTVQVLLDTDEVDAVLVGVVPLTAALRTTSQEIFGPGTLSDRLPRLFAATDKPMAVVVDSGPRYERLVHALRTAGVPVFRSADQAVRSLGRYLCHRIAVRPDARKPAAPETLTARS
jgi:acyl-CoA synthetase (NDP forming)